MGSKVTMRVGTPRRCACSRRRAEQRLVPQVQAVIGAHGEGLAALAGRRPAEVHESGAFQLKL